MNFEDLKDYAAHLYSHYIVPPLTTTTITGNWSSVTDVTIKHHIMDRYNWLMDLGDPRVRDWPLMSSPWPTLLLTGVYLTFCVYGPRAMGTKSYKLTPLVLCYNLVCILVNAFVAYELAITTRNFSWTCEPVDYSRDENAVRVASALWLYYVSKALEFLDSLFMVLRGKSSQLTFLHVYHHSTMFCLWWIGVKYVAGGSSIFGAMFNSAVHVLMYTYYGLSALGPAYRRYLGWKKLLTLIQMGQFVLAIGMGLNALRVNCNFPLWMQYAMIVYMISFLFLFSNFYVNAYKTGGKKKKT